MTACVDNNQKKGRGAKAVSATLAGVLAVGMVPAAAFATEEAPEANDEVSLLATAGEMLQGAKVTAAGFTNGVVITDPSDIVVMDGTGAEFGDIQIDTITFENGFQLTDLENGRNASFSLVGYQFAKADGSNEPVTNTADNTGAYTWVRSMAALDADFNGTDGYYASNGGTLVYAAYQIAAPGTDYDGEFFYLPFTLQNKQLDDAFLIENGNIEDTEFCWTGNAFDYGIAINDTVLEEGEDYTLEVRKAGDDPETTADISEDALTPGSYVATVTGINSYAGDSIDLPFTVGKLDLSQVTVLPSENAFSTAEPVSGVTDASNYVAAMMVNGSKVNHGYFDIQFVSGPDGEAGLVRDYGEYTYKLVADNNHPEVKNYVTGEKTVTYTKVKAVLDDDDFYYGPTNNHHVFGGTLTTDYDSDNPNLFDVNDVHVYDGTGTAIANEVSFDLVIFDANYNLATVEDLTTNGTWYVYAVVDSAAEGYAFGGMSAMMKVEVKGATISSANVVYAYDGKNMDTADGKVTEATYDGTDLMSHITVTVKDKDGNVLTQGEDYQLVVKDQTGTIVTEIVNAGTYVLDVTSDKYILDGDTDAELKVNPARIASLDVSNMISFGSREFYDYSGDAITPEFVYATTERPTSGDYKALPDVYDIETWLSDSTDWVYDQQGNPIVNFNEWTEVDEVREVGNYLFILHPDEEAEGVTNFSFDGYRGLAGVNLPWTTATVSDQGVYADVPADHWAADYIYQAGESGYMNGYAGTSYFGPNNQILRGEAATVLFRMAGGNEIDSSILGQILAQPIPFDDVDSGMFYTAPVVWASSAGIITGYTAGDNAGLFVPDGDITREEFALMLYRYAQATDQLGDAEAGDLSQFSDGGYASDWAREALEWCVGAGIMSGYDGTDILSPGGTITRAEACKMIVELQPEALDNMFGTPVLP